MPVQREGDERVTPLELFLDLVFVLAVTQCTALMAAEPTWAGLGKGLLVLAVLWWAWVGYAWFTSVLDPEEGAVRGAMFAVIAAFLVAALAIPHAFVDTGLTFAVAYGVVRLGHLVLFGVASREAPLLRRAIWTGLVPSTIVGVGLVGIGSQLDPGPQAALWAVALLLDMAGPFVFGSDGWQLVPGHFAERHGLIFLIALGESIVALGVGAESGHALTGGVVLAAVVGVACCAGMWWVYFDVTALMTSRRLAECVVGREQNELARDVYSLLHLPLVAGVVLVAYGLKSTLHAVDEPLGTVAAAALVGGMGLYLLAHVAMALRSGFTAKPQRLGLGLVLIGLIPVAHRVDAVVTLAGVTVLVWAMVAYETTRFAEVRDDVRHGGRSDLPAE